MIRTDSHPSKFQNTMYKRELVVKTALDVVVSHWQLIILLGICLNVAGCYERIVEPADVFGDITRGETYSPASTMIDDWYAVEAIDLETFAINERKSSQYNTILSDRRRDAGGANDLPDSNPCGRSLDRNPTPNGRHREGMMQGSQLIR
ncbi:MAG: hypothetical protein IPM58_04905 [Nitrospira sp.]|nr:hypothetical protein [Nitrospira sp.]